MEGKMEQAKGFASERLTPETLNQYWSEIAALEINGLDKEEGRSFGERKDEIRDLYEKYLGPGKQGELFVLKKDGKIVAFLAIEKFVAEHKAEVRQFRLSGAHSQVRVLQEIFHFAQEFLQGHGYYRAVIEDEGVRGAVGKMAQHFPRFLKMQKSAANDNEPPSASLEKAA